MSDNFADNATDRVIEIRAQEACDACDEHLKKCDKHTVLGVEDEKDYEGANITWQYGFLAGKRKIIEEIRKYIRDNSGIEEDQEWLIKAEKKYQGERRIFGDDADSGELEAAKEAFAGANGWRKGMLMVDNFLTKLK
jgi:hypothetical protein